MEQTTTSSVLSSTEEPSSFKPSDAIIGLERASLLLCIGSICILVVLIFGIILCRLDMSAGNKRRSVRQYIEN